MYLVYLLLGLAFISFSLVILRGAPFLPTLGPQIKKSMELSELKPGQTLIELGSGDGRVLLEAAKRGIYAIGYELNPVLVLISVCRTWRYRKYVKVIWGDFWLKDWPPADVIFVFLLTKYMKKLDTKCMQYTHKPVKLVSFVFEVPHKKPAKVDGSVRVYNYGR
ncbi:MAG TPA: hypothetical protein VFN51_01085 [Candidatus Saccharimonadales bacterium]|nr:hypothetical protein [Candidatus Saccharimonadales bacterium]